MQEQSREDIFWPLTSRIFQWLVHSDTSFKLYICIEPLIQIVLLADVHHAVNIAFNGPT